MDRGDNSYCCIFCQRSDETKTTGNLLNTDDVTAHQYCLLYSSGLFCTSTPEYDELYGFSIEDVKKEAKRGRQLFCNRCKKRGATSGCEVRRCKKSFHYPCAVEEGAKIIGNRKTGQYTLFCLKHSTPTTENGDSANKSRAQSPSEAGTSKDHCPACQKSEGNIRLDSLSKNILMSYCDKHAPSSHMKKNDGKSSAVKQPSPSCSSSSSHTTIRSFKRRLSFTDWQKGKCSSKKKRKSRIRIQSDGSSDSGMENLIPPLESDFDESVNSLSQKQVGLSAEPRRNSIDSEITPGYLPGNEVEVETTDVNKDENEIISDAESESLLRPLHNPIPLQTNGEVSTLSVSAEHSGAGSVEKEVQTIKREVEDLIPIHLPEEHPDEPSSPERSFTEPPPSQEPSAHHSAPESTPHTSSTFELALCEPICVTLLSSFSSQQSSPSDPPPSPPSDPPPSPPSDPPPSIDSTCFWRNCNTARCTQAIFSEFINEMNEISSRILSDQASQEECDRALSVMMASGRFEAFLARQQEELQRKQEELQKEAAAMKDVMSALRK